MNCKAEATLEDAVKGDKPSSGSVENAVKLLHGVIRTRWRDSKKTLQSGRGWWNMRGASCPGARRVETFGRHLKDCIERSQHNEFVPFGEKVLARPVSSEPLNRMNPRYKFGVWLGVRNNSAECFVETAEGVVRAREVRW